MNKDLLDGVAVFLAVAEHRALQPQPPVCRFRPRRSVNRSGCWSGVTACRCFSAPPGESR